MKSKINFEKITKFIKSKNFFIAVCVFVLTLSTIGVSYASFFTVKTNSNNQSVSTGTLQVSYGNDTTSAINKENMESLSDELGLSLSGEGDVKVVFIQNTGSLNSTFTLNVGYDMENFTNRQGYKSTDPLTPLDYIKIAVYEYNGINDETLIVGPITIADLPIYSSNSDYRYNRYSLLFDTVGSTTSGDATKTYKIKTWLSDKAIPAARYTYFYINTEVVAEVENAKMSYNLSGVLKDSNGVALNGATISLQNGSLKSTTNSSGTYSLNGIYPGVYNLDITYNGKTYNGNLTVEEGSSNSLTSLGSSFTGSTTSIFTQAKSYGTTLANIINKNNITTYSSAVTFNSGTTYYLKPTYKLVGGMDSNINNLNISLNTGTEMFALTLG